MAAIEQDTQQALQAARHHRCIHMLTHVLPCRILNTFLMGRWFGPWRSGRLCLARLPHSSQARYAGLLLSLVCLTFISRCHRPCDRTMRRYTMSTHMSNTCLYISICLYACVYTYLCTCPRTHVYAHTGTYVYACTTVVYTPVYTHAYIHVYIHIWIHFYTYVH